jgi:hypothetical protein
VAGPPLSVRKQSTLLTLAAQVLSLCMHGLGSSHGTTLHAIGARIGFDWNSVPFIANRPWQSIAVAVVARARAAGSEGPKLSSWRRFRHSNC